MDRPAYDHGTAPSTTSQPYPPIPQHPPTTQEGHPHQPYSQYSYDIQMRYNEDTNRQYSQDPNGQTPHDVPRQYTSMNSPYARDPSKDGPTSPYPKEILSPYTRENMPTSPYAKEVVSPYAKDMPPQNAYPPMPAQYPPMPHPQSPGHPPVQLPPMAMSMQGPPHEYGAPPPMIMDTTGQVAPSGMKPRVTATLWEDEGTLCFQVDVKGTCVARREDNHMVNGTKLLNVAGMTRGRRDGILKAEKQKHVVKIGPMHLKGVWIPYERALAFANKENITPLLYPLFVHNIGALLYHPINNGRAGPGYPANQLPRRPEDNAHPQQHALPPQHSIPQQHTLPQPHQQQLNQHQPPLQQDAGMFHAPRDR